MTMTSVIARSARRSLCIALRATALGAAALAAAGAAAAQSYYPTETTTSSGPITTYGPGYRSTTTTTTTYRSAATAWPSYEVVTSAPYESAYSTTYTAPAAVYEDPGITVYSRPYRHENSRGEISGRVSYADIDLSTEAGANALRWRVDREAKSLCAELGEPEEIGQNTSVLPSCQAAARDTAYAQVRSAVAAARYRTPYYAYGR
jgi:UrcA family protein